MLRVSDERVIHTQSRCQHTVGAMTKTVRSSGSNNVSGKKRPPTTNTEAAAASAVDKSSGKLAPAKAARTTKKSSPSPRIDNERRVPAKKKPNYTHTKKENLVNDMQSLIESVKKNHPTETASLKLAAHPMHLHPLAKKLLSAQEKFKSNSISTHVDIGYHYTTKERLVELGNGGLRTNANGDFGITGICTANNPYAFAEKKLVGLIVVRLLGKVEARSGSSSSSSSSSNGNHNRNSNTIRFNESMLLASSTAPEYHDKDFLQTHDQCLPVVKFSASIFCPPNTIMSAREKKHVLDLHTGLQNIVDGHLNDGQSTKVTIRNHENRNVLEPNSSNNKKPAATSTVSAKAAL